MFLQVELVARCGRPPRRRHFWDGRVHRVQKAVIGRLAQETLLAGLIMGVLASLGVLLLHGRI